MVAQPSPNIIIRKQDDYPDVLPTQSQQPKKGESSGNGKKSTLKKILKKTGEPKIQPESQCNVFSFNRKLIEQAFTNAWNAIK